MECETTIELIAKFYRKDESESDFIKVVKYN